jgi:hypothetical protein
MESTLDPVMVRVPCSSTRKSQRWAILLTRVDAEVKFVSGYEGTPIRPGSLIPVNDLWPTAEHPRIPVMLEFAGHPHPFSGPRRRSQPDTRLLWRFDVEKLEWLELARVTALPGEWDFDFRPIALRAMAEARGNDLKLRRGFDEVVLRVRRSLDTELEHLEEPQRARALVFLQDELLSRLTVIDPLPYRRVFGVRAASGGAHSPPL